MKTFFIKAAQNPELGTVLQALKQATLEHEEISDYDPVFSLSYDKEDQFFIKTADRIVWARVFPQSASYREISSLGREIQKLLDSFQSPVRPYLFFQEISSGHGLLKALPGQPQCFEFSFVKTEQGTALVLKDFHPSFRVAPPPALAPEAQDASTAGSVARLSRSEISELIELSLELKHLKDRE